MTLARLKTSHCRPARPAARDQVTQAQARKGTVPRREARPAEIRGAGGETRTRHQAQGRRSHERKLARARLRPRVLASGGGVGQGAARESLSHQGCSLLAPSPAADARITCIVNLEIIVPAPHTRRATPPGQRGRPAEGERASAEQQTTALARGSASEGNALPAGAWRATGPRDGSAG